MTASPMHETTATPYTRIKRLRKLMAERNYDAIILRNNPDLRWVTGAERVFDDESAHTAVITADELWLHTDARYFGSLCQALGAETPWHIDRELIEAPAWAAARIAQCRARVVALEDRVSLAFYDELLVELGKVSVSCLLPRLHDDMARQLRVAKDADEVALLRKAQRITDDAFEYMCNHITEGMTEHAVRAELDTFMLTHGADALSFETIVAAGPNGAHPHARPSDRPIERGDMVVIDFGACYRDYHADMTRTVCVGQPTDEQRHVYDVVRQANERCAAAIAPGVVGRDIHNLAARIIADAGYGDYFTHGLGHGVGIEIHEQPRFSRLSQDVIPVGAVITDEPGIYLPGRFGVRIEDCGVVDHEGYHPLSRLNHELVCIDCSGR